MKVPGVDKAFQSHINFSDHVDMVIKNMSKFVKPIQRDEENESARREIRSVKEVFHVIF